MRVDKEMDDYDVKRYKLTNLIAGWIDKHYNDLCKNLNTEEDVDGIIDEIIGLVNKIIKIVNKEVK